MPLLIEGKRLNVHKQFLAKSKAVVGKTHEPFFVLMLRAAEAFVTPLVHDDRRYWYGMSEAEVNALSDDQLAQLYRALLTYYSLTLTGDNLPGTLKERVQLTIVVNETTEFGEELNSRIPPELSGARLFVLQNWVMAEIIAGVLKAREPDLEQIRQTLQYTAIELIGKPAVQLKNRKCFVATSAFQNEEHETVFLLRRFRDGPLSSTKPGRQVICIYEQFGPKAAKVLDCLHIFKPIVRGILNLFASFAYRLFLHNKGFNRTPESSGPAKPSESGGGAG